MKKKLTALALAGALALSLLTACGPQGDVEGTPTPAGGTEVPSTPTPAPKDTDPPAPANTPEDTDTPEGTGTPSPTEDPAGPEDTKAPEATPTPVPAVTDAPQATPSPAPTPEPTPEPASAATAADVGSAVLSAAGGSAMSDMSFVLEEFYSISAGDLEDFVLYMPDMSANIEEIFIAKVASGKMDAVKSACESRQKGMAEDAKTYPATGGYVDGYKLTTQGDWLLFCVCENPGKAVEAFQNSAK